MRVLYVYKANAQDPTEIALRRWLPRVFPESRSFCFQPHEKRRGSGPPPSDVNERLLACAKEFRPTHVLCWVPYLNIAEIHALRALGARVTAAANGASSLTTGLHKDQAVFLDTLRELEFYLLPHFPHVNPLRAVGIEAVKFPFCADTQVYHPSRAFEAAGRLLGFQSVFIGNFGAAPNEQGAYRARLVEAAAAAGKVLLVSDRCFEQHGLKKNPNIRRLPTIQRQSALNAVLNLAPFSLGVDLHPNVDIYNRGVENLTIPYTIERDGFTMRPRSVWSMAAGRAFLLERFPDIQELFEDGKEILLWSSMEEATEHLQRLGRDDIARRRIAEAGRRKTIAKHSAPIRLAQLRELWSSGKTPQF